MRIFSVHIARKRYLEQTRASFTIMIKRSADSCKTGLHRGSNRVLKNTNSF